MKQRGTGFICFIEIDMRQITPVTLFQGGRQMSKKKKVILIIGIVILALAIIIGIIYWIGNERRDSVVLDGSASKVNKLCFELEEKQAYSFRTTLDKQNEIYYAKKNDVAYIETTYQGETSKLIIKNGNSYLLSDDEKIYYTYQNNETNLEKVTVQLEEIKKKQYTEGKEKIENKEYKYEEYEGITEFLVKDIEEIEEQTAKTRFYFNGDQLVYIKTIVGDYQEVLKVDISDNVNDKLFEIPEDYKEV